MNQVLRDYLDDFIVVYLYEIIVFSESMKNIWGGYLKDSESMSCI